MPLNNAEQKFFEYLAKEAELNPPKSPQEMTVADFREASKVFNQFTGSIANVSSKDIVILARDGYQIRARIYNYDLPEASPVLVMFPGCGFVIDLFEGNAVACSRIAKLAGIRVILVQFRLTPENPLIKAFEDSYDAVIYIVKHASDLSINPNQLFLGGFSSGATCATIISNQIQQNTEIKIVKQILLGGAYDLSYPTRAITPYIEFEQEDKLANKESIQKLSTFWNLAPDDYINPNLSPYYATDLTHLPPTTIIVGEYDGIRGDSEQYYLKLKQANVACNKIVLQGQTHNTLIMRGVLSDGIDPAQVFTDEITQ